MALSAFIAVAAACWVLPVTLNEESVDVPEASDTDRVTPALELLAVTGEAASLNWVELTSAEPKAFDVADEVVLNEALPVPRVSVVASADRVFAAVMPVATAC